MIKMGKGGAECEGKAGQKKGDYTSILPWEPIVSSVQRVKRSKGQILKMSWRSTRG